MRIVDLEAMNEWPAICAAVGCVTCGANPGEPCLEKKQFGGPTVKRIDFHAERKYAARDAWEHSKVNAEVPVGSVPVEVQPERSKRRGKDAAAGNP